MFVGINNRRIFIFEFHDIMPPEVEFVLNQFPFHTIVNVINAIIPNIYIKMKKNTHTHSHFDASFLKP